MADDSIVVALVHSHHLLDHKPDNLLLKGSKFKLRGFACLGRPGVALCVGGASNIAQFQSFLEDAMPQKKFATIVLEGADIQSLQTITSFEPATLGDLRGVLAGIGQETVFFELTGIDPSNAVAAAAPPKTGKKKKRK